MAITDKAKQTVKETNREILGQTLGLITSAFVLVAALAWNDAIHELITRYLNAGSGIISRFVYAILVTIIAAIVGMKLSKLSQKLKDQKEQ